MLLPCYYHHVLHHHFDLFLITKSLLSRGKRASRVGGSRSRWQAGRTSINLHQLKVEEDRHALYQISANYMSSSSRSLQTTTTVVLTIINNIHDHSHNQCSAQCYHNLAATATQYGPREALRSAQLAATNQDIDMANAIVIVHTSLYSQWGGVSICPLIWLLIRPYCSTGCRYV